MSMWISGGIALVGTAASIYAGSENAKSQAKQASALSNAENNAIAKQNMSQIVRNSYRTGLMNMQLGLQKKQAVQQGFDTGVQFQAMRGAAVANKEGSASIGASAEALTTDLEMQYENSKVVQEQNFASIIDNYNNELDGMRMNAMNAVVDAHEYKYNGPSMGSIVGGALISTAMQVGSQYAQRQMSLGLNGTQPPAPVEYRVMAPRAY